MAPGLSSASQISVFEFIRKLVEWQDVGNRPKYKGRKRH